MSEADRVFARREEVEAQSTHSERRLVLSMPWKGPAGGGRSRVVEVVHVRRSGPRPVEDRPRPAPRSVRAAIWPGELLLGVKVESPEGVARCEEVLAVPGIGFAELGPGDLGLSLLGRTSLPLPPYPPEMQEARDRVFAACRANRVAFLEACTPDTVAARIYEGVRVVAGGREDTARAGRAHQRRSMPV